MRQARLYTTSSIILKTFMTEALRDGKSGGWKIEQRGEKGGQGGGGGEIRNKRREDQVLLEEAIWQSTVHGKLESEVNYTHNLGYSNMGRPGTVDGRTDGEATKEGSRGNEDGRQSYARGDGCEKEAHRFPRVLWLRK
ncbi:hypothetical protein Pcinc_039188 [Petrolisthes cinctipes]|uniref:Uncharacterized protein n=1 Tax=Petrolisthes cinctipes TaxID=88211 RepID=A0AAE1BS28_PETCI|nr:hypothetical protein Pcinc_039188 [Petrolisthes cinctipes]